MKGGSHLCFKCSWCMCVWESPLSFIRQWMFQITFHRVIHHISWWNIMFSLAPALSSSSLTYPPSQITILKNKIKKKMLVVCCMSFHNTENSHHPNYQLISCSVYGAFTPPVAENNFMQGSTIIFFFWWFVGISSYVVELTILSFTPPQKM